MNEIILKKIEQFTSNDVKEWALKIFGIDLSGKKTNQNLLIYFNNEDPAFSISMKNIIPSGFTEGGSFYQDNVMRQPNTITLSGRFARYKFTTLTPQTFISPILTTLGGVQNITNNKILTNTQRSFIKTQGQRLDTAYHKARNYYNTANMLLEQAKIFANLLNGGKDNVGVKYVKEVYDAIKNTMDLKVPITILLKPLGTLPSQYLIQDFKLDYDPLKPFIVNIQMTVVEYQNIVLTYSSDKVTKINTNNFNDNINSQTTNHTVVNVNTTFLGG